MNMQRKAMLFRRGLFEQGFCFVIFLFGLNKVNSFPRDHVMVALHSLRLYDNDNSFISCYIDISYRARGFFLVFPP